VQLGENTTTREGRCSNEGLQGQPLLCDGSTGPCWATQAISMMKFLSLTTTKACACCFSNHPSRGHLNLGQAAKSGSTTTVDGATTRRWTDGATTRRWTDGAVATRMGRWMRRRGGRMARWMRLEAVDAAVRWTMGLWRRGWGGGCGGKVDGWRGGCGWL
jgi:hypothetical protein